MDPREDEIVADLLQLSWRQLAELLRQSGLSRIEGDRKQDMAKRLARRLAGATPLEPSQILRLEPVLLLEGPPEVIEEISHRVSPVRLRLLSRRAAVVPAAGQAALRHALPPGATITEAQVASSRPRRSGGATDLPVEIVAAGYFVRHLSRLLAWPDRALAGLVRLDNAPLAEEGPRVASLLNLWTQLLDASLGGDEDEPRLRPDESSEPAPMPEELVRASLERAIDEQRCALLVYRTEARGVRTRRVVESLALQTWEGAAYLHAFCRWRGAPRVFRLDRIESCRLLDERFGGTSDE